MEQLFTALASVLDRLHVWSVVDIAVVAVLIYGLLSLVRGTTAASVLYGFLVLLAAVLVIRGLPELVLLNWLLVNALPLLSVALIVLFQPELRRAMERIGRVRVLLNLPLAAAPAGSIERAIAAAAGAARTMSVQRQGALVVFQRETGLQEYIETGTPIDGAVTAPLLVSLFFPHSPLHDGAVVVEGDRILAAGCRLPISKHHLDPALGLRHRAAIGVTEESDAVALVVSEETGALALAHNGQLERDVDPARLERMLAVLLQPPRAEPLPFWRRTGARWLARRRLGPMSPEHDEEPAASAGRGV
ncbi:MAG: TIGR00159 family protein [Chloroflexi bacterium]|nr:TIGR00159 family protein [Chloroflexota bacterium]